MADYLKNFAENEVIKASDTNSNNQYLLDKIGENYIKLKAWLDGQIGTILSNIQSGDATLQKQMDELEVKLTKLVNGRVFTEKTLAVNPGIVNLTAYLPEDEQQYLVFVNASFSAKGSGAGLSVKSDIMTIERTLYGLDGDAGRSTRGVVFAVIPVGIGRTLTFSGYANWISLCGYMKI